MLNKKAIGILGGMGPEATLELFDRIIKATPATCDQDHVNLVIMNDPQIPDRTNYIFGKGESPIPKLLNNLKKLNLAGAELAIIPCMTAHSFIEELQRESPIPIVNTIHLIDKYLDQLPEIRRIGLLATKGSYKSEVFQKYINKEIIIPTESNQKKLMEVIYGANGIKTGNTSKIQKEKLMEIIESLNDVQAVITGCTELSLVLNQNDLDIKLIDPISILADYVVSENLNLKQK